jgi:hypothetical protein
MARPEVIRWVCYSDREPSIKGRFSDRRGDCCLVGALDFVSSHHAIKGDAAERYLADAVSEERGQQIRRHENEDYAQPAPDPEWAAS